MQMDRNPEYDIYKAMQRIENELIESMMRNFDRHRAEEKKEGYNWTAWQAEQLKALEQYKQRNLKKYQGAFGKLNSDIESMIRLMRQTGRASQEIGILEALKKGYRIHKEIKSAKTEGRFFKVNDRKLNALIKATMNDMEKAEQAVLRMANDKYRKAIFAAQVYANTGAGTYEKAVDMATKDMLSAGLNCVEYKNGARHTLANYARMAIKTANKRAYLMGEGEKRAEWGVHTVILKKRGNACPLCLPFVGKILIDDVYSGGSKADGNYPLLSAAMAAGLYHPNCKDIHTTYFPGISTPPEGVNKEDVEKAKEDYTNEQKQNYCKNNAERFQRMSENSLDPDNKRKYAARAKEWEEKERVYQKSVGEDNAHLSEKVADNKLFADVTEEWYSNATPDSHKVIDLQEYAVDGTTYKVDGKHVLMDYKEKERQVAELIEKELGGEMYMVPRVLDPPKISTPDYIFRGEKYDLKELSGTSGKLVYNRVSKMKKQANNFILEISNCPLSEEEIRKQIEYVYWSGHTEFVDKFIVIKDNKILNIFMRNKK